MITVASGDLILTLKDRSIIASFGTYSSFRCSFASWSVLGFLEAKLVGLFSHLKVFSPLPTGQMGRSLPMAALCEVHLGHNFDLGLSIEVLRLGIRLKRGRMNLLKRTSITF